MTSENDKAVRDLKQVLEISRAMVATNELGDLLTLIINHALTLLGVERATLFLYDEATDELVARIATGVDELRVPADKGICGQTVQTGKTIVVPDAYADERFNPQVDKDLGFRTRNLMTIPLKGCQDNLVGVLQVLNKRSGDFSDWDIDLAEALGAQAGVALQRARLLEHFLEKQKMERAMQIARDIQRGLLPDKPPSIAGFEVAGLSDPADETGGDTFDFIPLANGQWAFVIADATGHGIGPALVIAETRAMLRACAHFSKAGAGDVTHILDTANYLLSQDLGGGSFVTCFLGILDPETHEMTYASAGHGPMIFYRRSEDKFFEVPATFVPLGILEDASYEETKTFHFAPGDIAVVTTDGFFEAFDPASEMFGVPRMLDHIRSDRDLPCQEIIDKLHRAVNAFSAGLEQADDLTAVVIKRQA